MRLCGGEKAVGDEGDERRAGANSWLSSVLAMPGSEVSMPSAVPERAPAEGTMSIGARGRFW